MRPKGIIVVIAAGVVIVAAGLLVFALGMGGGGNEAVIDQAQRRLKNHLKTPSTAVFSDESAERLPGSADYWRVSGTVETRDGAGKTHQSRYEVGMVQQCADTRSVGCWHLAKVKINQFVVFSNKAK